MCARSLFLHLHDRLIGRRDRNAIIDHFVAACKKRAFGKLRATEKLNEPSHMLAEVADDKRTPSFRVLSLARDVPRE